MSTQVKDDWQQKQMVLVLVSAFSTYLPRLTEEISPLVDQSWPQLITGD